VSALKAVFTLYPIAVRSDVKKHLSVPFRNAIFRGIIATERCCFAQLLKVVYSVSDRCFFAPLRKAIRYSVNVSKKNPKLVSFNVSYLINDIKAFIVIFWCKD
jgi:hypothetical protein